MLIPQASQIFISSHVVLEKTLASPLDCKEIQPVHPKGDQSWVFIGKTDVQAETPILWLPHAKSWLIWKDPDAGKDWGQEEETTEDKMVGWHHWLNGHGFGRTLRVGDGQGGLACCGSWGCKELDTTERLNWYWYQTGTTFSTYPTRNLGFIIVDWSPQSPPHPWHMNWVTEFCHIQFPDILALPPLYLNTFYCSLKSLKSLQTKFLSQSSTFSLRLPEWSF